MYTPGNEKNYSHVRLDHFSLLHRGNSSHVELQPSCLCLLTSNPNLVPTFEDLPYLPISGENLTFNKA